MINGVTKMAQQTPQHSNLQDIDSESFKRNRKSLNSTTAAGRMSYEFDPSNVENANFVACPPTLTVLAGEIENPTRKRRDSSASQCSLRSTASSAFADETMYTVRTSANLDAGLAHDQTRIGMFTRHGMAPAQRKDAPPRMAKINQDRGIVCWP